MAKPEEDYRVVDVESYVADRAAGKRGKVHIRPCAGQGYPTDLHVECSKKLSRDYPVGTRFRIQAKLTDREGGGEYLYSHYKWKFSVLG